MLGCPSLPQAGGGYGGRSGEKLKVRLEVGSAIDVPSRGSHVVEPSGRDFTISGTGQAAVSKAVQDISSLYLHSPALTVYRSATRFISSVPPLPEQSASADADRGQETRNPANPESSTSFTPKMYRSSMKAETRVQSHARRQSSHRPTSKPS